MLFAIPTRTDIFRKLRAWTCERLRAELREWPGVDVTGDMRKSAQPIRAHGVGGRREFESRLSRPFYWIGDSA